MNEKPSYYRPGLIEAIDVIEDWGWGFSLGNVVKYVCRAGRKGDAVKDLEKARWYIDREIRRIEHERYAAKAKDGE